MGELWIRHTHKVVAAAIQYNFHKNRSTKYRNTKIQKTETQKYRNTNYRNTNYINSEIQII